MNTFRWLDDGGSVGPVEVYLPALSLFLSGSSIHVLHEVGGRRSLVGLPFFSFDEIGDECLKKKKTVSRVTIFSLIEESKGVESGSWDYVEGLGYSIGFKIWMRTAAT